ncbi:hypothetical protein Tco_1286609, partial [Tanacetum coccineum]
AQDKESTEIGVSTEDKVSTDKPKVSTDKPKVSTNKPKVSTDKPNEGTTEPDKGTAEAKDGDLEESVTPTDPTTTSTPTPTVFGDDETIAEFLVSMSQNKAKQKRVEIRDTEEGVDEAERKFDQLVKAEEIARKVQEDWEAEEEMKKLAKEEATKATLIQDIDDIQARIKADRLLAARLQEGEREMFTVKERAKLILLLLKGGGKKHADLKNKNFEEIQVLYKEVKRSDKDFIAISSAEDERQIKEMNEESI